MKTVEARKTTVHIFINLFAINQCDQVQRSTMYAVCFVYILMYMLHHIKWRKLI